MLQKYFIAIVPPEPILSSIRKVKQDICDAYGTKGALRSPAHITLHMPFSWEEQKEEKLITELSAFGVDQPLSIRLKDYGCFEPRVVFIGVEENAALTGLQQRLVRHAKQRLQLFNQAEDMRGFHPHVTVAFRDLKKPAFYELWKVYRDEVFHAEFECASLCLLKHHDQRWDVYREFDLLK